MPLIKPFEENERVCFIGDSITVRSYWISGVFDYYVKNCSDRKVKLFPCGVGGGGCISAMTYFHEQTVIYNPTTVVIMLGMNDVNRDAYFGEFTPEKERIAKQALLNYESNLAALSLMIKNMRHVKRFIYLTPTPYDEEQISETYNLKGVQNALRKCAEIVRKTAERFGGEYYDLGKDMVDILYESHRMNKKAELVEQDRVHPNTMGFSVMAKLFLSAQGFDVPVNADDVVTGKAMINLSEKGNKFNKAAFEVQNYWTIEWCLARQSPDQTKNGKISFSKEFIKNFPEADPYFKEISEQYEKYALNVQKLTNDLISCNESAYV